MSPDRSPWTTKGIDAVVAICLSLWLTVIASPSATAQVSAENSPRKSSRILLATNNHQSPADSRKAANERGTFPVLRPASEVSPESGADSLDAKQSSKVAAPVITVASSLLVVLGLFTAVVWGSRKFGPGGSHKGTIPKEVMHALGAMPIDARTQIRVLRIGHRILVLSHSGTQLQTLCEIVDPDEVREFTAACSGQSRQEFASTLRAFEQERVNAKFTGGDDGQTPRSTRRGLFMTS